MYKAWIGLFLAATISVPASAEGEWLLISKATTGAGYYVRGSDAAQMQPSVVVWVKVDAATDRTLNYRTAMIRYRFDCSSQTYAGLSFTSYRADGSTIMTDTPVYPRTVPIVPETTVEQVARFVCGK